MILGAIWYFIHHYNHQIAFYRCIEKGNDIRFCIVVLLSALFHRHRFGQVAGLIYV